MHNILHVLLLNLLTVVTAFRQAPLMETNWFSKRYLIAFLAFFGFANIYALRVNLSVAIVVMTSNYTIVGPNGPEIVVSFLI